MEKCMEKNKDVNNAKHIEMNKKSHKIYICVEKHQNLARREVCVGDVCKVFCSEKKLENEVNCVQITKIKGEKAIIATLDIIEAIQTWCTGVEVVPLGETQILVEYEGKRQSKIIEVIKIALGCILIFFGSAFTIMAFNNDISISLLFEHLYRLVKGVKKPLVSELEIAYSLGLAVGILIFFNHVGKRKLSKDVTPIQIEMNKHNKDRYSTTMDLAKEKDNA